MVSVLSKVKVSLFHKERLVNERPLLLLVDKSAIFIVIGPVVAYAYCRNLSPLIYKPSEASADSIACSGERFAVVYRGRDPKWFRCSSRVYSQPRIKARSTMTIAQQIITLPRGIGVYKYN